MLPRLCLALISLLALTPDLRPDPPAMPKLAVVIVFDQLRGDYLVRWRELFVAGGFKRLQEEGVWFDNCHFPYAMTATGPGHASIACGCSPDRHGIVANNWHDRKTGELIYCPWSDRYERVPPVPPEPPKTVEPKKDGEEEPKAKGVGAPVRLLAPTLGDALKGATGGRGRVFCLSWKDRAAVPTGGQKPDGCYWFDADRFVTTTYYRDRPHPWVARFNRERPFDRWFGAKWERLRADLDYDKWSGPDDGPGEDKGKKQGVTFPHPFGTAEKIGAEYYDALAYSPYGNQVLFDLACLAIEEEKLGRRDDPDLLIVSFSSNDLVGHTWGPESHEVLDVTLRSDRLVRNLLTFLDEKVGKGNYVIGLSADHGVGPVPEVARALGRPADRIDPRALATAAEIHLRRRLGDPGDARTRWIETVNEGGIYLNDRLIAARGQKLDDVAAALAGWLRRVPIIEGAYTGAELSGELPAGDEIGRMVKKSFVKERSGDVLLVTKPFFQYTTRKLGTTHGTPYPYDTHVPLIVYGPGVKGGRRNDRVTPQALAAILAKAIGVPAPAKAEAPVPAGLFEK